MANPTTTLDQGEVLKGQQYEPRLDVVLPFEWQKVTMGTLQGAAATDLEVVNKDLNLRKAWDLTSIRAALDASHINYPATRDRIDIPDELTSLSIVWNKGEDDGEFSSTWGGAASGPSWSLNGSVNANSHGGASVMPELVWSKKEYYTAGTPVDVHEFYMASNCTMAQVLARASALVGATVNPWPVFKPVALTFVLSGGKVSCRADVQASAGRSFNENDPEDFSDNSDMWDKSEGTGLSMERNLDVRVVNLPPMLFGAHSLTATQSAGTSVTASVGWSGFNFPSVSAVKNGTVSISGSVSPNEVSATTPAAVPTSGLYAVRVNPEPVGWGRVKMVVEILNMANLHT